MSDLHLFMTEQYSIVWMNHIFFIHLFITGHLGRFYLWAMVNNAAINTDVKVSVALSTFVSLW